MSDISNCLEVKVYQGYGGRGRLHFLVWGLLDFDD